MMNYLKIGVNIIHKQICQIDVVYRSLEMKKFIYLENGPSTHKIKRKAAVDIILVNHTSISTK